MSVTTMSLLLTVDPKCTLVASHAATWWITMDMPTGQTDRRTDARPLHYAFGYGRDQRKNRQSRTSKPYEVTVNCNNKQGQPGSAINTAPQHELITPIWFLSSRV